MSAREAQSADGKSDSSQTGDETMLENFEHLLFKGHKPVIEQFLRQADGSASALLPELVLIELEYRLKAGEPVRVEEYWRRFPELTEKPTLEWEMIQTEFAQRARREPGLSLAEFVRRFPRWEKELAELQVALDANSFRQVGGADFHSLVTLVQTTVIDQTFETPVIDGYEIEGELGKGGMGVVYKARQTALKRTVALKFVRRDLCGSEATARFRTEAEAAARLDHPHIVKIYDFGVSAGRPFIALEYLASGTLADKIEGKPQPIGVTARLVETLARAVQAAHEKGIIHRDLKPTNILLQCADPKADTIDLQSAIPKISDFGLAKLVDADQQRTHTGAILGTPTYMAPEQAHGDKHIGPAADIWALGVILYELLTGRLPFQGTTAAETLLCVLHDDPLTPRRHQPRLPRDLETICLTCLQKNPGRRYASAAALAEDLRRFQAGEAIQARPAGVGERAVRWARRHPTGAVLMAVVLLAIVAGITALTASTTYLHNALEQRTSELQAAQGKREREREEEVRVRHQADWRNASAKNLRMAHQLLGSGELAACCDLLAKLNPPQEEDDFRGSFPCRFLRGQSDRLRWSQQCGYTGIHCVAFSPDGSLLATGNEVYGCICFLNAQGAHLNRVEPHTGATVCVAFSPDGETLAASSTDKKVRLFDCRTRKLRAEYPFFARGALAFSADGKQLIGDGENDQTEIWNVANRTRERSLRGTPYALSGGPTRHLIVYAYPALEIWDTARGRVLRRIPVHERVTRLACSSDERTIALGLQSGLIRLVDSVTGRIKNTLSGHVAPVRHLTFSPDGTFLASAGQDLAVRIWHSPTGKLRFILRGHRALVTGLAFSPDCRSLATVALDNSVKMWKLDDHETGEPMRPELAPVGPVAFSPNGRALAVVGRDGTIQILDTITRKVIDRLRRARLSAVGDLAWSPDNQYLAVGDSDGILELWDMRSRQQVLTTRIHQDKIQRLVFAPDSRTLATGGADSVVLVVEIPQCRVRHRLTAHVAAVTDLDFSPDGRKLVTGSLDGSLRFWEALTGKPGLTITSEPCRAVAYHPDGQFLAVATDTALEVRDAATGKTLREFHGYGSPPPALRFARKGSLLLGREHDALQGWDAQTGARRFRLAVRNPSGKVACDPAGDTVAIANEDGSLIFVDLKSMAVRHPFGLLPRNVQALNFTANGKKLVILSERTPEYCRFYPAIGGNYEIALAGSGLSPVSLWDVATGRPVEELASPGADITLSCMALTSDGSKLTCAGSGGTIWPWLRNKGHYKLQPPRLINSASEKYWKLVQFAQQMPVPFKPEFRDTVRAMAASRDGHYVATASDKGLLQIWDGTTWRPLHTLAQDVRECHALAFTPDGQTLVAGSGNVVNLWSVRDGKLIGTLAGHDQIIRAVAVSPAGDLLASAGDDWSIRLWDLRARRAAHTQPVSSLAFAPDGQTLASGSKDRSVKLWSLLANREVMSLERHTGKVNCLAFSPDGAVLASGGESSSGAGEVYLWRANKTTSR